MSGKRSTIYDIAAALDMSASYVSKALNDHPLVSQKIKDKVKKKAAELNYTHNSQAANLRQGSSKTIGVIVPFITQNTFSEAIAGIEDVCSHNNYSLIMCQSNDSFKQECKALDALIRQNVDCILLCVSSETKSIHQIDAIRDSHIEIIQFDRYLDHVDTHKVINDNKESVYQSVKHLLNQQYKKIAFLGGPEHSSAFKQRKEGYIKAIKEAQLTIPYNYIVDNALDSQNTIEAVNDLLKLKERPDAFVTVSDQQAMTILQLLQPLNLQIPKQIAIVGFDNDPFARLITPSLSTVDPKSRELGKQAATLYFDTLLKTNKKQITVQNIVVKSEIIIRQSSPNTAPTESKSRKLLQNTK